MISKTKLSKRIETKRNPELVETLKECKKHEKWLEVGKSLSTPRRKRISINLEKINEDSKTGDLIVVPGKVLSQGEIESGKKIKIIAMNFSENAKEKLNKHKIEFNTIQEEIKLNPEAKGVKIIK